MSKQPKLGSRKSAANVYFWVHFGSCRCWPRSMTLMSARCVELSDDQPIRQVAQLIGVPDDLDRRDPSLADFECGGLQHD